MKNVQEAMPEVKVTQLCRLFQVSRSSFYYQSCAKADVHEAVNKTVEEVAGQWPKFGYQGLTGQLRMEEKYDPNGKPIGERRVKRALTELGLLRKPVAPKVRTTNSEHSFPRFENLIKDRKAAFPDEIWASDITYIRLGKEFIYLAVILDLFTRAIRGWHLSRSLEGELTQIALKKAFDSEGTNLHSGRCPTIHHSDQGGQYAATAYVQLLESGQYAATAYVQLLESRGVAISMAAVGCPEENGYAERWMRTLKEEHVQMSEYNSFEDAKSQIGIFIQEVYQKKRAHSKLGYLSPSLFEERWLARYTEPASVAVAPELLLRGSDLVLDSLPLPLPVASGSLSARPEIVTIA